MKWVDLVEFDALSQKSEVALRATLEGGSVRLEGDPILAKQLEEKGVFSAEAQKMVKPADGEAFLAALGHEFKNPYLYATDVQEGEKADPPESFKMPPMSEPPPPASTKPPGKA